MTTTDQASSTCLTKAGRAVARFPFGVRNKNAPRQLVQRPWLCWVSAQLRHDSGQLADSSKIVGGAERWQVRSIYLFTLPSWSSSTSKEGKDAKKMQLAYEYDVQAVAEAVTQPELSSHKVHPA